MRNIEVVTYEWHVPGRVYIVHFGGVITLTTIEDVIQHLTDVFNRENHRVHVIFNGEKSNLDLNATFFRLQPLTARLYRHPLGGSIVTVVGMSPLYTYIANTLLTLFAPGGSRGKVLSSLQEAKRYVRSFDSSLPPLDE